MEVRPLTEEDQRAICEWRYPGEYAVYNLPSWEEMQRRQMGFANPDQVQHYHGFREAGTLMGFVNLLEEETEVFIGIGVEPSRCGQHYGRQILRQAVRMAGQLYPGKPLYLEVRTWNQRAVRCYEQAGFRVEGEAFQQTTPAGTGTFYRMTCDPSRETES